MDKPFAAYKGDLPYIFVCYAHEDSDAVYPEIAWLHDQGVKIWYDEGISPGLEWTEALASAIQGSSKILFFVTPHSVTSEHCRRELNFAQEEDHDVVAVHLGDTEVPPGLRLSLNNRQAILRRELSDDLYRHELMQVAQTGGPNAAVPVPQTSAAQPSRRRGGLAIAVLAAVAVVAGGAWWSNQDSEEASAPVATTVPDSGEPNATEILHNSIAVLPFANLSPDPDNAYFAAGIHEEILNQLAKIKDLSVIARTTMIRYANSDKSVPEIGAELNVGTVMEGSVRYAGNRVRITAQLIDARSGAHIWSEAYEEELEDIFGIQLAIAQQLADQFKAEFTTGEQKRIAQPATNNPEAYTHYLLAMSKTGNFALLESVHEALETAIALDPNFAQALAFNALMYGYEAFIPRFLGSAYSAEKSYQYFGLAQDYANRALAVDPNQAFAHLTLGHNERAFELNPNDYRVLSSLGSLRIWGQGRVEEGIQLLSRSIELNPADAANIWWFSYHLTGLERWEDALRQARNAVRVAPKAAFGHANLALLAALTGDVALARSSAAIAESLIPGPYAVADVARAYGRIGDNQSAKRVFDQAVKDGRAALLDPYWQFNMHVAVGELDTAMDYLERMVEGGFPQRNINELRQIPDHPLYDEVRVDPRFDELVRRVHMP